eukprot:GEMP01065221.1.p1 GENE.GEMP01065221.1~~GEMP01065221.1.p1  ORF type:complete len:271 (+),score=26.19 GEMP01065221.1:40-852(+)
MADVAMAQCHGATSALPSAKVFTLALLERTALTRRQKGESADRWVARTTHVHLEGRYLTRIGPMIMKCINLKYLYCSDNKIEVLDSLPPKVEAIYIDNNLIEEVELGYLQNLRIFSARNNRLKNIDSMAGIPLVELNVARQPISISPHVISGLARTLQILNLSDCQLTSLQFMLDADQLRLTTLDVSDNLMQCVEDATPALRLCESLKTLFVAGNPFCKQFKYRDSIIVAVPGPLAEIDDKSVSAAEKQFLKIVVPKRKQSQNALQRAHW